MKSKKVLALIMCLAVFGGMAIGSGSTSGEKHKDIVTKNEELPEENLTTIEEQVILEKEGIKITAKEFISDSLWGDGVKILIENNSDKTIRVGCDALILNNHMITELFGSEIAPDKKANETIYLYNDELKSLGINNVGQIEIYFSAYDVETYDDIIENEYSIIKTSDYDEMDTEIQDKGMELYNKGGIVIMGKSVEEDTFWGAGIMLYCENRSGKNINIAVDEMSINGFMVNPYFYSSIYDGKKSLDNITLLSTDLEDNEISSIDEVELKFEITDMDTYKTIDRSDIIKFSTK